MQDLKTALTFALALIKISYKKGAGNIIFIINISLIG